MPEPRSPSAARINPVVTAKLPPAPASERSAKLRAVDDTKDRLLMAVVLIALVALTGGWVYALGWVALKLIKLI
jgi:hypothetical protein